MVCLPFPHAVAQGHRSARVPPLSEQEVSVFEINAFFPKLMRLMRLPLVRKNETECNCGGQLTLLFRG